MRHLLRVLLAAGLAVPSAAMAQVYVKPSIRSDGTYVQGHFRSAPNNTRQDNYSTDGNINPYTGKQGTESAAPTYPVYQTPQYPRVQAQPRYQQPANPFGNLGRKCSYPCF